MPVNPLLAVSVPQGVPLYRITAPSTRPMWRITRMEQPTAHLIFLRSGLRILKRPDLDWRQLQDEYPDYMASLGPWSEEEIAEHFALDYGADDSRWPVGRKGLADFMRCGSSVELVTEEYA
jgi:hypothetical protein